MRPLRERRRSLPGLAPTAIVSRLAPAVVTRLAPVIVSRRRRPVVLSLAALGVILLLAVTALSRPARDPMLDAAPDARPLQVAGVQCGDLNARTERTRDLVARGDLRSALAVAEEGLTNPTPVGCAGAHLELARLWYAADLDDMLATSLTEREQVRGTPTRWALIERRADRLGVPAEERRAAMTLAHTAYDRGLWHLADAAFREAWAVGFAGAEAIEFRHALLRNWGHADAFKGSAAEVPRGVAMLKTAHVIAKAHGLKTDVACTDLRALGVADCATVTPDPDEPTLLRSRRAGAP